MVTIILHIIITSDFNVTSFIVVESRYEDDIIDRKVTGRMSMYGEDRLLYSTAAIIYYHSGNTSIIIIILLIFYYYYISLPTMIVR